MSRSSFSPSTDLPPFVLVILSKMPGIKGKGDKEINQVAKLMKRRTFPPGHVLREAGKPEAEFVVIITGQIKVETPPGRGVGIYDGVQSVNFQFGSGMFASKPKPAPYTATAITEIEVWQLTKKEMDNRKAKERKRYVVAGAPVHLGDDKDAKAEAQGDKTEEELALIRTALQGCVLLSNLNQAMVDVVAHGMERRVVSEGHELIKQGDTGDLFYVANKGTFDVYIDGTKVAQKKKGDFFGELALMHNAVRSATVLASGISEVFQIKSDQVRILVAKYSFQESQARLNFLKQVPLLKSLSIQQRSYLAEALKERTYLPGEAVVKQGDDGDELFIVKSGELTITVLDETAGLLTVGGYKEGAFFGELALINDAKRAATVSAKNMVVCLSLNKKDFKQVLGEKGLKTLLMKKTQEYSKTTKTARQASLSSVSGRTSPRRASEIMPQAFTRARATTEGNLDKPVQQTEKVASFTPIGTEVKDTSSKNLSPGMPTRASSSMDLLPSAPKAETSPAKSKTTDDVPAEKALPSVNRETSSIAEEPQHIAIESEDEPKSPKADETDTIEEVEFKKELLEIKSMAELEVLGTLGRGAFGHVRLVRDKHKKQIHAMKTLNKHLLVETQQVEHVKNEINVMASLNSAFVIEFRGWFQDPHHLHVFMQPSLGGELATLLDEKEKLTESETRFLVGCMVLGFEHLHNKGIVYRDLKPENLLLEGSGYTKIVDFGFAKKIGDARTFTLCGTPEYLSPEVIQGNGHGCATDFWSMGIIIFEMLTGETPYADSNPMATYQVIMRATSVPWPEDVELTDEAKAFCEALLVKEPPLRLGVNGSIREHPWFSMDGPFPWAKLARREVPSPFDVTVESEEDMSRFEDYMGEDERWQDYKPEGFDPFLNF
eukprot:gb/GEZN01001100.1/.p1 GENE.gb/GEZN01001100.1/~~gb/GEZN01001100.1/.p1  ORF type:complete len:890 (-),score=141.00 gb/GEZN01001100.1/:423-3092(-)